MSQKTRKNISAILMVMSFFVFVLTPMTAVFGQQDTGKPSGISYTCTGTDANGNPTYDCETFADLIAAIKNVLNFATTIALSFSVVVIVYAGWLYLTSGGNPTQISRAHKMFGKVAWGIVWILAAWLIINLIMTTLTSGTGLQQILQ
jgi:hypothetical protein